MHRNDRETMISVISIAIAAVVVSLLLLALPGCSFSLLSVRAQATNSQSIKSSPNNADCIATDQAHLAWLVTSVASSGLAGSSSVIGLFTASPGRYIAVGVSAVLGVFGLASGVVAGHEAAMFTANGCGASAP